MNFDIFGLCSELLRDPTVPEHRVVRKATAIAVIASIALVYYRHVTLGLGFGVPLFVTLGLSFMALFVLGILGGLLAGSFYRSFLEGVGAQKTGLTLSVFLAEWLFAATAPLLGSMAIGFLVGYEGP